MRAKAGRGRRRTWNHEQGSVLKGHLCEELAQSCGARLPVEGVVWERGSPKSRNLAVPSLNGISGIIIPSGVAFSNTSQPVSAACHRLAGAPSAAVRTHPREAQNTTQQGTGQETNANW